MWWAPEQSPLFKLPLVDSEFDKTGLGYTNVVWRIFDTHKVSGLVDIMPEIMSALNSMQQSPS
jgi:hypothetical protein